MSHTGGDLIVCLLATLALAASGAGAADATPDGPTDYVLEALRSHSARDLAVLHTDLFPGVVLRVKGGELGLFRGLDRVGLEGPRHAAFREGRRMKVVTRTGGSLEIPGAPDENWMLFWFEGGRGWDRCRFLKDYRAGQAFRPEVPPIDVPFLVAFQHRPTRVTLSAEGLSISGTAPLGQVTVVPLYGSGKPSPSVTGRWSRRLPRDVVERCRFWASVARSVPVHCREDYLVDEAADSILTRQRFDYLETSDDWRTRPRRIAPVSPIVALAMRSGFDVRMSDGELAGLEHVTHWGPYAFVDNADSNAYEVRGVLKYIDEVEVRDVERIDRTAEGFAEAERLMLETFRFPVQGTENELRDAKERIEKGYTFAQGVAVIAAWMRQMPFRPEEQREGLKAALKKLDPIRKRFFDPKHYSLVPVRIGRRELRVRVARPGAQTCSQDLVKETSCFPYYMWEYGYYSGDWDTIREGWDFVKSTFGLTTLLGWANPAPLYTAEHNKAGGTKLGPIGLARLGRRFGDKASYDLGAHLLSKALMNEWVWNAAAVPYIRSHQPWFQPLEDDMIVHELHGFCGLELMAATQENTYNEIPLVLDRSNLQNPPMREFADYYVRCIAKYFPKRNLSPYYRTSAGSLDELMRMTPKQMLGDIRPGGNYPFSHVHWDFYVFPAKVMEFSAPRRYERLHQRSGGRPEWRRGLDSLAAGMDWRQLAVPLIVPERVPEGAPPERTWPYLGWYLMLPPSPNKEAFRDDVLPLGAISPGPGLRLVDQRDENPNWNARVVSWDAAGEGVPRAGTR